MGEFVALLISISTCNRFEENGWNDALRDTWLQDAKRLGIEYRFFTGRDSKKTEDNVVLSCYDDYHSLMYKTLEKHQWAFSQGYTNVFHCYHDTYACPERLLLHMNEADYFGDYYHADPRQPWPHYSHGKSCQSGQGVFLSQQLLGYVVAEFPEMLKSRPDLWEEDVWTGLVARSHPELTIKDSREMPCNLTPDDHGPRKENNIISVHLSTINPTGNWNGQGRETEWKYRPEYMYKLHREWGASHD